MSDSLQLHELQHSRFPCPSLSPYVCSNSVCWVSDVIQTFSSSIATFSSCPQSLPSSGSLPLSWLLASGGQSTRASASGLPMNIQGWFPLRLTDLISLQSKVLSSVFSNATVQKDQFLLDQSLWSNFHICTWLLEKSIGLTRWTFVSEAMSLLLISCLSFS